MDIVTASEAHRITEEAVCNNYKKVLKKATDQIVAAAQKGKHSIDLCINCFIGSPISCNDDDSKRFVNAFEEFGYKTQKIRKEPAYPGSDIWLYCVTVSW